MSILGNYALSIDETITLRPTTAFNKAAADQLPYNIDAHLTPDLIAQGQGAISGGHITINVDQLEKSLSAFQDPLCDRYSEIEAYEHIISEPDSNIYKIPKLLSALIPFIQAAIDHEHAHSPFAKEKLTTLSISYYKNITPEMKFNATEWHIHKFPCDLKALERFGAPEEHIDIMTKAAPNIAASESFISSAYGTQIQTEQSIIGLHPNNINDVLTLSNHRAWMPFPHRKAENHEIMHGAAAYHHSQDLRHQTITAPNRLFAVISHIHTIDSAESVFRTLPKSTPRLEWDHF